MIPYSHPEADAGARSGAAAGPGRAQPRTRVDQRSDERLLEAYRRGETGALRELIERYQTDLLRFLTRLTGDRQSAEDVFQETFLQVHLFADSFDTSRRFKPWVFTIAANKARDLLRKKARRQTVHLSAPVRGGSGDSGTSYVDLMEIDVPAPDAGLDAQERDALVQRAVEAMSPPLREILLLAYFQRLSYAQVAEELGIPLGTVKSRLHAAVASFAREWKRLTRESSARSEAS